MITIAMGWPMTICTEIALANKTRNANAMNFMLIILFLKFNQCYMLSCTATYPANGKECYPCSPGNFKLSDCTNDNQSARCYPCPWFHYQPWCNIAPTCQRCSLNCPSEFMKQVKNCTAVSDIVCECYEGMYWLKEGDNDGFCQYRTMCHADEEQVSAGNTTSNTVCKKCSLGATFLLQGHCKDCTVCNSYQRNCTLTEDSICNNQTIYTTERTPILKTTSLPSLGCTPGETFLYQGKCTTCTPCISYQKYCALTEDSKCNNHTISSSEHGVTPGIIIAPADNSSRNNQVIFIVAVVCGSGVLIVAVVTVVWICGCMRKSKVLSSQSSTENMNSKISTCLKNRGVLNNAMINDSESLTHVAVHVCTVDEEQSCMHENSRGSTGTSIPPVAQSENENSCNSEAQSNKNASNSEPHSRNKHSINSEAQSKNKNSINLEAQARNENSINSEQQSKNEYSVNLETQSRNENSINSEPQSTNEHSINSKAQSRNENSMNLEAQSRNENSINSEQQSRNEYSVNLETQSINENSINSEAQSTNEHSINSQAQSRNENSINSEAQSRNEHSINSEQQSRNEYSINLEPQSKNENSINSEPQSTNGHSTNSEAQSTNKHTFNSEAQSRNEHSINSEPQSRNEYSVNLEPQSRNENSVNSEPQSRNEHLVNSEAQSRDESSTNTRVRACSLSDRPRKSEMTDSHLIAVSAFLSNNIEAEKFRMFYRILLGIERTSEEMKPDVEISKVEKKYQNEDEIRYQLMKKWAEVYAYGCCFENILKSLRDLKLNKVADDFRDLCAQRNVMLRCL